jgi:hypothetical protein
MKKLCVIVGLIVMTACGGSSGSDGGFPFHGGIWRHQANLTFNTCPQVPLSPRIDFTWTINQVEDRIVADSPGTAVLEGSLVTDNSFIVRNSARDTASNCLSESVLVFRNIEGSRTNDASLTFRVTQCTDGSACEASYGGTAIRQ